MLGGGNYREKVTNVHFRPHFGGYEETRPFDAVAICNDDTVYTQNAKYASNDFLLAQGKLFGHGSACCGAVQVFPDTVGRCEVSLCHGNTILSPKLRLLLLLRDLKSVLAAAAAASSIISLWIFNSFCSDFL